MLRRVHRPRRAFAARQCGAPVIVVDLRLVRRVLVVNRRGLAVCDMPLMLNMHLRYLFENKSTEAKVRLDCCHEGLPKTS
ncbi:hypothetical protein M3J09_012711 [Ascochyta lentis]